jgi:endothelin-converting enzyme/putative endopeptidase
VLARIDAANTIPELAHVIAWLHLGVGNPIFAFGSGQDFKDASQVIGNLDQAGLGLPDRDYYLENDPKTKEVRNAYVSVMKKLLVLAGATPADAARQSSTIMRIETALAKASLPRVELRDPQKVYHRVELNGLIKLAPAFPWKDYLADLGYPNLTQINVTVPAFLQKFNEDLLRVPLGDWKTYLRWQTILELAPTLNKKFVDTSFELDKALSGTPELEPRWKRCVNSTDRAMGEALGAAYVKREFSADGKRDSVEMVRAIESQMEKNLASLSWMDDATRKKAQEKLHAIANKIGYPDKWRNYEKLDVAPGRSYAQQAIAAGIFGTRHALDKIGKPLDRSEWFITPPTVNAFYDPSMNEMVFPAGILAPPFYGRKQPPAMNYGAIGMVMGHELTHGFDDEGRQFDAKGNLTDWWSPTVSKEFDKRAQCVVDQYSGYVAVDDVKLDGKLVEGENIADLGGLKLAYSAFKASKPAPAAKKGEFTDDQLFFLGFAQSWCSKRRDEYARLSVKTDTHSPERFRVLGPLGNFKPFSDAFQCKAGQKMVRPNACAVW